MNKPLKVTLITLGSLLGLVVIAIVVVCTMVFSKERLTKATQNFAADYVTCQTEIGSVELTFFSSFPDISLCLNDVAIINPMEGAQSDTLLGVHRLLAKIDVMAYLKDGSINISGFTLKQSQANIYINEDSVPNYDVFRAAPASEEQADTASAPLSLDQLSLHNIDIVGLTATYLDRAHKMEARLRNADLSLDTEANLQDLTGGGDIELEIGELFYSDSLNYAQLSDLRLRKTHVFYDGTDASVSLPHLSVGGQEYLLSGDLALLAKIWGMQLDDVEASWKDGRPSLRSQTRLDSSMVTMGKEDMMYISTGATSIEMPLDVTSGLWTSACNTRVDALCVSTDADGTLADRLDIRTRFEASTNGPDFNDFYIKDMSTQVGSQSCSGQVHVDMTDTTLLRADLDLTLGATTIGQLLQLVPEAYRASLKGMTIDAKLSDTHVVAKAAVGTDLKLDHVSVQSQLDKFDYKDDTNLRCLIDRVTAKVSYPDGTKGKEFGIDAKLCQLDVNMADDSSKMTVLIPEGSAQILLRDDILQGRDPRLNVQFDLDKLQVAMDDTVQVEIGTPRGRADVDMASVAQCIKVDAKANLSKLALKMGAGLSGVTGTAQVDLQCLYDERQKDALDMVRPVADFSLRDGRFDIEGIPYPVVLPELKATFNSDEAVLNTCQLNLGNSQMNLKGVVRNINDWLKEKALLEGQLSLTSPLVDVGQLMDLTSGIGCEEEAAPAESTATTSTDEAAANMADADPFLVPKDVKFIINTDIAEAKINENSFDNVRGQLTIDDGVLVLEEMGFTSKAAQMQLTAIYKSPRRNNLFVGWNFHLLNIDIAEMIRLVPEVDTIVPMLSSFAGKAEFHLAGETSLFADYSPKMSTLKAVAAIEGHDLTILDSETFQTIKKYLFKESTTNKIDTLSVEMAVARKNMTLYPMLISWDKYQAVLSGTHNITGAMPFNYHISITKCPLVGGHLGLDINGNLDDVDNISFKLGSCKYANLYRPEKRNVTQSQTLELKKLINSSLKRAVKPTE